METIAEKKKKRGVNLIVEGGRSLVVAKRENPGCAQANVDWGKKSGKKKG